MKNHQLSQDNTLKKKKPMTYNEIKKAVDSMSDFNKSQQSDATDENKPANNPKPKTKAKVKKSVGKMMKKFNFDIV